MPTFRYQAYTTEGKSVRGRREGLNAKDVRESLLAEGLYAKEVTAVSAGGRRGKFTLQNRSMFYRELSALLQAGLPLDRSLEILSEHPELGAGDDVLPVIRDRLREGEALSATLQEVLPGVRGDEVAVLAAGEAAGSLATVAGELADFLDEESRVSDQLRNALIYPVVISVLALVVLGVLVGYLLPVYEKLLGGINQTLPLLTRFILSAGAVLRHPAGLLVLAVLLLLVVHAVRRALKSPQTFLPVRRFRLPVIGYTVSALARARFSRTLAMLIEGGVPLPEAVKVAGRATGSAFVSGACDRAADEISQGSRVADAVGGLPVLQEDLPGWIRAGEASGDLAGLLRHASKSHQRAWNRGLSRTLSLVEPVLIISVGVLILLVALAILLPMLKVNQSLSL